MHHTKGPWGYDTDPKNYGEQIFIHGDEGRVLIAEMNHNRRHLVGKPENVVADARVLAAAPSLLEACQAAEAFCPVHIQDQIRAAVKKALEG
jgi:hypothetical protein